MAATGVAVATLVAIGLERTSAPAAPASAPAAPADGPVILRLEQPPAAVLGVTDPGTLLGAHPSAALPFKPPPGQRASIPEDRLAPFWADGEFCAVGCRAGAKPGWPLRPFDRQHPLRSALNELRTGTLHSGIDIQGRDGQAVYSIQDGRAEVPQRIGGDARVRVGRFEYWHIDPAVKEGDRVIAYRTVIGTILPKQGHVHLAEIHRGRPLNPLRPGGRLVDPYRDDAPPVIGVPELYDGDRVRVSAYDPQSYVGWTTYATPVLAPAALAYRVFDSDGRPIGTLHWALRGSRRYPNGLRGRIYAPGAHPPGHDCLAERGTCRPDWRYRLAGGLAHPLPRLAPGVYRLTVYAWDWTGNASARDMTLRSTIGR